MSRSKKRNKATSSGLPLLVTIGAFDTRDPLVRHIAQDIPLDDVKAITSEDYQPWGGTPLNDAVLKFGEQLDEKYRNNPSALHIGLLADESGSMGHLQNEVIEGFNTFVHELRDDDTPATEPGVIMVVMTDGLENSSKEDPSGSGVQAWIKQREDDGWNFFYLGANQDAWATGLGLGLGVNSATYDYAATPGGTRTAMASTSDAVKLRKTTDSTIYASTLASSDAGVKTYDKADNLTVDITPPVDPKYTSLASDIAKKVKTDRS